MTAELRTKTSIEDAIIDWIEEVFPSGMAILAWPDAPRPKLPYVSAQIIGIAPIGMDDYGAVDLDTGYQVVYGDRLVTVSINAFGTGAIDKIRTLMNSISKETIKDSLIANGLCPQNPGPLNDLTGFLETEPEERAHFDMMFGIKDLDTDNVGVIEHVSGNGTIIAETGEYILISFSADLS